MLAPRENHQLNLSARQLRTPAAQKGTHIILVNLLLPTHPRIAQIPGAPQEGSEMQHPSNGSRGQLGSRAEDAGICQHRLQKEGRAGASFALGPQDAEALICRVLSGYGLNG